MLTGLGDRHHVRDVGHEDPTLELQLCVLVAGFGSSRLCLVLFVLALVGGDLLAAQQDALEEIDLILEIGRISKHQQGNVQDVEVLTSFS